MRLAPETTLALTLALALAGCTTARIEYDRMTDAGFPRPEVVDDEEMTLTTIFWQGGRLVTVADDDTTIAPLTGPANPLDPDQYDYITLAELETVELANRADPVGPVEFPCGTEGAFTCIRYHLYGIVADHFWEGSCGAACRSTTTLGRMYAGAGGTTNDRSAFVNFWKNATVSGDNAKYLRSAAHEIGHAFNLNHCDGDGATTIMNQTGVVGDTFAYGFSSTSLDHLQNHPGDAVWPGTGPRHYDCPHVP